MNEIIKECLEKYNLNIHKIINCGNYYILEGDEKYLLRVRNNSKKDLYDLFNNINYTYYQPLINSYNDSYELSKYFDDITKDKQLKAKELLKGLCDLQNKTINEEDLKKAERKVIYEKYSQRIDNLFNYYLNLQDSFDELIFPNPDQYYLLLNISKFYKILRIAREKLTSWYQLDKQNIRKTIIIGNLNLDNFRYNDTSYFLEFKSSEKDLIVYDFVNFYKKNYYDLDMSSLYKKYRDTMSINPSEVLLLEALICIPNKIVFTNTHYNNCVNIYYETEYIERTMKFVLEEDKENQKANKDKLKEEDKNI